MQLIVRFQKLNSNFIARLRRSAQKARTPQKFLKMIVEELFVRTYTNPMLRRFICMFVKTREPQQWVFLVGCYNSGTTLLQHILSSHKNIAGMPREGVRFTSHLENLEHNGHHMVWAQDWREHATPSPDQSAYAAKEIMKDWSIFWKKGADIFLDKSVANTARIEWLAQHFPNAKFIGLHRNGYCISEGLHRRSKPPQWLVDKTGDSHYPLATTGEQWVIANQAMMGGLSKVDHSLIVSFENLIKDPISELENVFSFIGLKNTAMSFDGETLTVNEKTFSIRSPNAASLKRLGDDGAKVLKPIISSMMQELGYDD